jgi:hypothetical protein
MVTNLQHVLPVPFNHLRATGISTVPVNGAVRRGISKCLALLYIKGCSFQLNNDSYLVFFRSVGSVASNGLLINEELERICKASWFILIKCYSICQKLPRKLRKTSNRLIGFQVKTRTRHLPDRTQKCSPLDRRSIKFSQKTPTANHA